MKIGYACVNPILPGSGFRKCRKNSADDKLLNELISYNIDALESLIDHNIEKGIRLFRIGSDIIPFGSDDINKLNWREDHAEGFARIGKKIRKSGMRVSMHPGQYTVLNSPDENTRKNAVKDIEYHCSVLDLLGTESSCKIILHVGGAYGDKSKAASDFIKSFKELPDALHNRIVIENDDRIFNIGDVIEVAHECGIPAVFDNLHNEANPSEKRATDKYWIQKAADTWRSCDGVQKIHYSQQDPGKRKGAHSERIDAEVFLDFCNESLPEDKPDIMLEVKDKNLSAVKCILCSQPDKHRIKHIEEEWSLYKYLILERSPAAYNAVRNLLKDKSSYPALEFYRITDEALSMTINRMNARNAALHVWGYFKGKADESERKRFFRSLDAYCDGSTDKQSYKTVLSELALKYEQHFIRRSYYLFL